jgi:hypothetical protein
VVATGRALGREEKIVVGWETGRVLSLWVCKCRVDQITLSHSSHHHTLYALMAPLLMAFSRAVWARRRTELMRMKPVLSWGFQPPATSIEDSLAE